MIGQDSIGDWSQSTLVKFIRDLFQNQPPDFLPLLKAEEIFITEKISVGDKIEFARESRFRKVGGAGNSPFLNSWVNYGSNWADAAYWRDPFKIVHLRGLIKTGTVGSAAFTLPPAFRPEANETFSVLSNSALGRVDVQTDGQVIPASPSSNTWVSLSGITFKVV